MIHLTRSHEAQARKSFDVSFDLLASGPRCMMTKMKYRKGNQIPFHSHPNEQIGYVVFGRIRVLTRNQTHELVAGDTYAIPENIEHSIEVLEDSDEIQVFSPPRPEFR